MSKQTNLKDKEQQTARRSRRVTEKRSLPQTESKINSTYTVQNSDLGNGVIDRKVYADVRKKIKKEESWDPSPDLFSSSFSEDSREVTYDLTLSEDSGDDSFTIRDEVAYVLRKNFGSLKFVRSKRSAELWKEIIQDPSSSETSSDEDFKVTKKK